MFAGPGHYSPGIEDSMPRMHAPTKQHLDLHRMSTFRTTSFGSDGSGSEPPRGRQQKPLPYPVDDEEDNVLPLQRPSVDSSRNASFSSNASNAAQRGSMSSTHPPTFTSALRDSFFASSSTHRGSLSTPAAIFYPSTPSDQCPSPTLSSFSSPSPQRPRPDTTSWLALGDREGRTSSTRPAARPKLPYRRSESLMVIDEPEDDVKTSPADAPPVPALQSPLQTPTQVLDTTQQSSRVSIPIPLVTDVNGVTRAASIEKTPVSTPELDLSSPPPSTDKDAAVAAMDFGIQANPWSILPVTLSDSYHEPRLSANLSQPFSLSISKNEIVERRDSQLLRRRQERNVRRAERSPSPAYSDSDSQGSTATPPSEVESMSGFDLMHETPRGDFLKRFSSSFQSQGQSAEDARNELLAMVADLRSPMEDAENEDDEDDAATEAGSLRAPSPTSIYSRPMSFCSVLATDSPTLGEDSLDSTTSQILAGLVPSPLSIVTNARPSPVFSENAPSSPSSSVSSQGSMRSTRPKLSLQTSPAALRTRSAGAPHRGGETMDEQYARFKAQFAGEAPESPDTKTATPTVDCAAPPVPPMPAVTAMHRRFSFESAVTTPIAATSAAIAAAVAATPQAKAEGQDAEYADLAERNVKRAAWEAARQAAREAEDAEIAAEIAMAAAAKHQRSASSGSSKNKPLPPLPPPKDAGMTTGAPPSPPTSPPAHLIVGAAAAKEDTIGMPPSAKFEAPRAPPKTPVENAAPFQVTKTRTVPPPLVFSHQTQLPRSPPPTKTPPPPTPPARAPNRPVLNLTNANARPVTYQPLASIGMPMSPPPAPAPMPSPPATRGPSPPAVARNASAPLAQKKARPDTHIPLPTFADAARYAQPGAGARARASLQHVKTSSTLFAAPAPISDTEADRSTTPPAPFLRASPPPPYVASSMAPCEGQAPVVVPRLTQRAAEPAAAISAPRPRKTAPVIAATIVSGASDPATRDILEPAPESAQARTARIQREIVAGYEAKVRAAKQQQQHKPECPQHKDKALGKKKSANLKFPALGLQKKVFG